MAETIKLGQPPIEVTVKQSARARRISLRVSGLDGKVSLTVPRTARRRDAHAFLTEKEPWIRSHLQSRPDLVQIAVGTELPVEGMPRRVVIGDVRAPQLTDAQLLVPAGPDKVASRCLALLKVTARDRLASASQKHAETLGRPFHKITLRDTRSRWGSCTSQGNLMYSWRLILAPPEVLDYVAAHEVAHLAHMDHSQRFWTAVGGLCPGYQTPRAWLRRNGATLHRYQF